MSEVIIFSLYIILIFVTTFKLVGINTINTLLSLNYYIIPAVVVWFSLFFGGFFLVSMIEMLTGWPPLNVFSASVAVALLALTTLLIPNFRLRTRELGRTAYDSGPIRPSDRLTITMRTLVVAVLGLICVLSIFWLFRYPAGYESRAYVLPYGIMIFDKSTIRINELGTAFTFAYPANYSLYFGALARVVPEHLLTLANLPFIGLLVFATSGCCRALGSSWEVAVLMGLGIMTIPVFVFYTFQPYPDVAGFAFIACALALSMTRPVGETSSYILAGLACGLAYGMKQLNLVPAALLGIAILSMAISKAKLFRKPSTKKLKCFSPIVFFALGFIAMAGAWLLRGWLEFGNPLYPTEIGILAELFGWYGPDLPSLPGIPQVDLEARQQTQFEWVRNEWEWLVYPWLEWHRYGQNYKMSSGFGSFVAALIPLCATAIIVLPPRLFQDRERVCDVTEIWRAAVLLLGGIGVVFVWWMLGDRQPRYVGAAFVFLIPVAGWILSRMNRLPEAIVRNVLVLCAAFMFFVFASRETVRFGSEVFASFGPGRAGYYEYIQDVDNLPRGSVIANMFARTYNYGLLGANYQNRIVPYMTAMQSLSYKNSLTGSIQYDICTEQARNFHIDYIYTSKARGERIKDCESRTLEKVATLAKNPSNGVPLPKIHVLYQVMHAQ